MKIGLKNSVASLNINTNGAYIDNFEVKGVPIFFPKVMVKIGDILKVRGGMHVCTPNFGLDKRLDTLPAHGFGRDLLWQAIEQQENFVKLALDGKKDYENVSFMVEYRLEGTSLFLSLKIKNNSNEEKLIAPGFHPYFYADHRPIDINNRKISKEELPDSIYVDGKDQRFTTNGTTIDIIGIKNINKYVFWTDFKGDYICVEPTYNGNAFEDSNKNIYRLEAKESFEISCRIKANL